MTPVVIAHRGASGYRPENTLAAIEFAVELGAEWIELDLVSTSDHVLVIRHENEISSTTDVTAHPEFADRRTTRHIDGEPLTGWFTEDFTVAELKSLRAVERRPDLRPASARYDGRYEVPTLADVLTCLAEVNAARSVPVGAYLELKHPTYFAGRGLGLVEPLLADLARHDLLRADAPLWLESMEVSVLRELASRVACPLTQLMMAGAPYDLVASGDPRTYRDLCTPAGLAEIAGYASRIGPSKHQVLPRDGKHRINAPSRLVGDAHAAGLGVHVWTLRDENTYLPANLRIGRSEAAKGDAEAEYFAFFDAGVDGVFTDFLDTAHAARSAWLGGRSVTRSESGSTQ